MLFGGVRDDVVEVAVEEGGRDGGEGEAVAGGVVGEEPRGARAVARDEEAVARAGARDEEEVDGVAPEAERGDEREAVRGGGGAVVVDVGEEREADEREARDGGELAGVRAERVGALPRGRAEDGDLAPVLALDDVAQPRAPREARARARQPERRELEQEAAQRRRRDVLPEAREPERLGARDERARVRAAPRLRAGRRERLRRPRAVVDHEEGVHALAHGARVRDDVVARGARRLRAVAQHDEAHDLERRRRVGLLALALRAQRPAQHQHLLLVPRRRHPQAHPLLRAPRPAQPVRDVLHVRVLRVRKQHVLPRRDRRLVPVLVKVDRLRLGLLAPRLALYPQNVPHPVLPPRLLRIRCHPFSCC